MWRVAAAAVADRIRLISSLTGSSLERVERGLVSTLLFEGGFGGSGGRSMYLVDDSWCSVEDKLFSMSFFFSSRTFWIISDSSEMRLLQLSVSWEYFCRTSCSSRSLRLITSTWPCGVMILAILDGSFLGDLRIDFSGLSLTGGDCPIGGATCFGASGVFGFSRRISRSLRFNVRIQMSSTRLMFSLADPVRSCSFSVSSISLKKL
uniref:(northern house mosquito) hypothetical protein n=1 Tax=Culex pipiens TaxID=7175 RepID=A0A8D8NH03_CULPI